MASSKSWAASLSKLRKTGTGLANAGLDAISRQLEQDSSATPSEATGQPVDPEVALPSGLRLVRMGGGDGAALQTDMVCLQDKEGNLVGGLQDNDTLPVPHTAALRCKAWRSCHRFATGQLAVRCHSCALARW